MPARTDPLRIVLQVLLYVALYYLALIALATVFQWLGVYLVGLTAPILLAAALANWISLRIHHGYRLWDAGLWWRRASAINLALGLGGGMAAACLVLAPPLMVGAAHMEATAADPGSWSGVLYLAVVLAIGAAGEELLFRGYGFQVLLGAIGPFATILPVGVVFALLHGANPHATAFGIANTAGFGILFGYAYWRSRDLWLPIGLHFGWNLTLPLFGVNLSGLTMRVTGHAMAWSAGRLWSGGNYGPEASVLTSAALVALWVFISKAPVSRQASPLEVPPAEDIVCESSRPLAS
ncbi:MAG: lysostaphin resistance A-like protein [Bryobacteraceae bacterium]